MRHGNSWSGWAAAVAFAFLGTALSSTAPVPAVGLAAVLSALAIPILAGWALPWRRPALARGSWIVAALAAAAILVAPAWSDTLGERDPLRAAGGLLLVLAWVAAVPSLTAAGAGLRRRLASRSAAWRFAPLPGLVGLLAAAWTGALLAWPEDWTRMAFASALQAHLTADYPHRGAGPDLEALWERHAPRLRAADRACGADPAPCEPFVHALRDWMAELRNGHTWAALDGEVVASDVLIEPVEGKAVITDPGEDGAQAGLEPGMVLLAVDGVPVDRALARLPGWATAYRAARTRRYYAFRALLDGAPGTSTDLEVEDEAGGRRRVRLRRPEDEPAAEGEPSADRIEPELEAPLEVERLDEGYGYLWIQGFEGPTFSTRADAAIDSVAGLPGLVLDLRHNAGGYTDLSRAFLGRFFASPVRVGLDCVADGSCTDHLVEPRARTYTGPLAVLIDEDVFSAGELAAHGLCATGRARCFGRPTAGETDAVVELDLPGGRVGYAASDFRSLSGASLFGRGVVPQQLVPQRLDDVRAGRDPELDAAIAWLDQAVARRRGYR